MIAHTGIAAVIVALVGEEKKGLPVYLEYA